MIMLGIKHRSITLIFRNSSPTIKSKEYNLYLKCTSQITNKFTTQYSNQIYCIISIPKKIHPKAITRNKIRRNIQHFLHILNKKFKFTSPIFTKISIKNKNLNILNLQENIKNILNNKI